MCHFKSRLLVALLTLKIGLFAVFLWVNISPFPVISINELPIQPIKETRLEVPSLQVSDKVTPNKYIGLRIAESLPDGLELGVHFLIGSKSDVNIPMDFGIREVSKGKLKMLWLERVAELDDAQRVSQWEILDVLVIPQISRNQVFTTSYCFIGKEYEPEVFAIFDNQDKEYLTRARRAWKANRLSGKFEDISVRGVKCENESWNIP
jgi:hypothetical protein